jgi:DNA-directed RNA polymerase subunit RPC12/RpoP
MAYPVTCRVCGERFTFDPEKQPHEARARDDAGGQAVEREVRCPRCGSRRWVRFAGKPGLPPP